MSSRNVDRPRRFLRAAGCIVILAGAGLAAAQDSATVPAKQQQGYPTPSIAPVAWEIDFKYRTPRRIVVQAPGQSSPRPYWYTIYTVTNNGDEELFFVPAIEMMLQDGRVIPANRNIPMAVFDAIQKRARGTELTPPQEIVGNLLIGEDAQRSSVAIWEEPSPEMGTFEIYVGGLSGEIVTLLDSNGEALKDPDGKPIRVRKTRQLRFKIRGDDRDKFNDEVDLVSDTWVMR
jgi:hypothetical protein